MNQKIRHLLVLIGLLLLSQTVLAAGIQFSAPDLNGKIHKLSDYKGKWVVVNYWATWCPPCLDELPELVEFHEKHADKDAVVLGINLEEISQAGLKEFVEQYFISYPILKVKQRMNTPFGVIYGLPTTFLVSPDGKVVASKSGGVTQKELEEGIQSFINQKASKK